MRATLRRLAAAVLLAAVFGFVVAAAKGNGAGVRSAAGNTSAPWLLLPFVAAALIPVRRVRSAAAFGLVVSLTALSAFYLADTWVLALGPHDWPTDLRLTVTAGRRYFVLALLSGPVFGALGGRWQRHPRSVPLTSAAVAPFLLEPLAVLAVQRAQTGVRYLDYPAVWVVEVVAGCLLAVVLRHRGSRATG